MGLHRKINGNEAFLRIVGPGCVGVAFLLEFVEQKLKTPCFDHDNKKVPARIRSE